MARQKEITIKLFVNGEQVETLTAEQRESMAKRMGKRMSTYYSNHIDEYKQLKTKI